MTILFVNLICDDCEFNVGEYLSFEERDKAVELAEKKIVPLAKKYFKDVIVYTSYKDFCNWTNVELLDREFWKHIRD